MFPMTGTRGVCPVIQELGSYVVEGGTGLTGI